MPVVLGVSCSWDEDNEKYHLNSLYARGIVAAGGIPFIIPDCLSKKDVQELPALLSGMLLSGGGDVDPAYFGEEPLPACGKITPERDAFEIELARICLAANLPVLGICRGAQIINIAAGGDVYQDINTQLKVSLQHNQKAPYWAPTHNIMIQKDTFLEAILGEKSVRVNSFHHQSIRNPAPGFIVSARSSDGVIEAIESTTHPFCIGVQCHPEGMWERDSRFLELFRSLVTAGREKF